MPQTPLPGASWVGNTKYFCNILFNDLISRSLRDFLREDITEVLIDSDEAYDQACEFSSRLMPDFEERIKRYDESIPLFTRYQIESQIERSNFGLTKPWIEYWNTHWAGVFRPPLFERTINEYSFLYLK